MKSIQDAIKSLHAKGLCPRLHVDVTHADAVCPDFVREKWQQRLVIDLDPSYPLDLSFTKLGVEADLSFGGFVTRCVFPWAAIYIVAERGSGRGQVFATNIPASLRHEFGPPAPTIDRSLTEVRDDPNAKKGTRRRKRRGAEQPEPRAGIRMIEGGGADEVEDQPEDASEREAPAAAAEEETPVVDQLAQKRRSAFKVIDGGG